MVDPLSPQELTPGACLGRLQQRLLRPSTFAGSLKAALPGLASRSIWERGVAGADVASP